MKQILIITLFAFLGIFGFSQNVKLFSKAEGVSSQKFWSCVEDSSGNIWFAGTKEIIKCDGEKITTIKSNLGGFRKRQLMIDKQNNLLIYDLHGTSMGSESNLSKIQNDQLKKINSFWGGFSLGDGFFWEISTDWSIDGHNAMLIRYDGIRLDSICAFGNNYLAQGIYDRNNDLWLNSLNGIIKIHDKISTHVYDLKPKVLKGFPPVSSFFEDSKGKMWVATYGSGILCFDNNNCISYSEKDGLFSDYVYKIIEDKNGTIWAAHYAGGISYKIEDAKTWVSDQAPGDYPILNLNIYSDNRRLYIPDIEVDSLNNVWYACVGGSPKIFGDVLNPFINNLLIQTGNTNLDIYISKYNKNNIWIRSNNGTYTNGIGLHKYNLEDKDFPQMTTEIINDIYEFENGDIWFTSSNGLFKYNDNSGFQLIVDKGDFTTFLRDKEGNCWAGSKDGIYFISNK